MRNVGEASSPWATERNFDLLQSSGAGALDVLALTDDAALEQGRIDWELAAVRVAGSREQQEGKQAASQVGHVSP